MNEEEQLRIQQLLKERAFHSAAELLRRAADCGDADAQYELGVMYRRGEGLIPDNNQAAYWWERAASLGHPLAEYNLGTLSLLGDGVPLSVPNALTWTEKAARHGHPDASYKLSVMLEGGMAGDERRDEAPLWLIQAAEAGHSQANFIRAIGEVVRVTEGDLVDWHVVGKILSFATLQRHPAALFVMREILESEIGIAENSVAQCFLLGAGIRLLRPDLEAHWRTQLDSLCASDAARVIEALGDLNPT